MGTPKMQGLGRIAPLFRRMAPWFYLLGLTSFGVAAFAREGVPWLVLIGIASLALAWLATDRAPQVRH